MLLMYILCGNVLFTLCAYAQQGYAFVALVCVYTCMCICGQKNWLFEVLPLGNLTLVQSTARSSNLTAKKGAYYAR